MCVVKGKYSTILDVSVFVEVRIWKIILVPIYIYFYQNLCVFFPFQYSKAFSKAKAFILSQEFQLEASILVMNPLPLRR